jgi:hypothetical protein
MRFARAAALELKYEHVVSQRAAKCAAYIASPETLTALKL